MRWNDSIPGEERIVIRFLWFPLGFVGKETRWLEFAYIKERCYYSFGKISWYAIDFATPIEVSLNSGYGYQPNKTSDISRLPPPKRP